MNDTTFYQRYSLSVTASVMEEGENGTHHTNGHIDVARAHYVIGDAQRAMVEIKHIGTTIERRIANSLHVHSLEQ